MTDELDDLKTALYAAIPTPDADRKAENITMAQKNFADLQGLRVGERPTSDRPSSGLWRGVSAMITAMSSRGGLVATTALIAVTFVALGPGSDLLRPPSLIRAPEPQPATATPVEAKRAAPRMAQTEADMAMAPATAPAADQMAGGERASPVGGIAAPETPALMAAPNDRITAQEENTEAYANAAPNPVHVVAEEPVSTFSIDVDTASYAVVRNSLKQGYLPNPDAVRVEEMVNYFPYAYPAPEGDAPFQTAVSVVQTPWNPGTQLVHIGIQGALPAVEDRPPLDLVFLIDTSGSMNHASKLPLLKQSLALMLGQLRPTDQVAIVTYAGSAGQVLEPTAASDREVILSALNRLDAGGSTAGQAGLQQAYAVARDMTEDGDVSRVILATDGDFNVGLSDPEELKNYIAQERDSGTYLSVLGFGRGNLDDATMQALAQNGDGTAAYIDTLSEAQKVLVDQLTGVLFPIADDVKIQVEFNPAQVAEYRLIGYETRILRREDFKNDKVDAGEIGAGHSVTALYEITPVGSNARLTDPLRYGTQPTVDGSDELGFLRLRYKAPGETVSSLIETPITADLPGMADTGFAAAIAGFGQLLRDDSYLGDWSWGDAIALANKHRGADPYGYRTEAVQLMRLAQSLSAQ